MTLSETIKSKTLDLINNNNAIVMGQCLTAVGWVGGTIPELENHPSIIELSMADVAGGGLAVGAALGNTNPVIYVVRYQGFLWYNGISIANYAAKSNELFGIPCPLIVRAIAMEGGIGPVAGNYHLSLFLRMPGINIFAPMTSEEWLWSINYHLKENLNPTIIGEHRLSFHKDLELPNVYNLNSKLTILAIGSARIFAQRAYDELTKLGHNINIFHLFRLSPLDFPEGFTDSIKETNNCLVLDSDYTDWGQSESLGYKISKIRNGLNVEVLGLDKKSAGFSRQTDNLPPNTDKILLKAMQMIIH